MNGKFLILSAGLIMIFLQANPQTVQNSLEQKLHTAQDSTKVNILISLCQKYAKSDIKKGMAYGREALKEAKDLHYTSGIIRSLSTLAENYSQISDERNALNLRLQLLEVYKKENDLEGQAKALLTIGNIYDRAGAYPQALQYYFKSLRVNERLKDQERRAIILWNIGSVYEEQQNDSASLNYYLQSLSLLEKQKAKNYSNLTMISTSIGFFYKHQDTAFDHALVYFQKALEYAQKIPSKYNTHAIAMALTNIGTLYETEHDHTKALAYNQKSFEVARQTNDKILLGLGYENRARIYRNMGFYGKSNRNYREAMKIFDKLGMKDRLCIVQNALSENHIRIKELDTAAFYALKALKTAKENDLPGFAEKSLENLVEISAQAGLYEKALHYQQQYQGIRDTLLNHEKNSEIAKLQILYETEQKQRQIDMLRIRTEKERILRYVLLGCFAFLIIIGLLIYRQQRLKNRKDKMIYASQQQLMEARLTNTKLHEEQLQNEVKLKNKELTSFALNFIQKNQLLETLKTKIMDMRKEANGVMSQKLNNLQHIIRHSFNLDEDWNEFRLYFEQVHDQFFKELNTHYPDLSGKELRLCALLKLNLSTKEMATILGISPASVKMARYRLRKKLNLDSENDLTAFMIRLEKNISEKNE